MAVAEKGNSRKRKTIYEHTDCGIWTMISLKLVKVSTTHLDQKELTEYAQINKLFEKGDMEHATETMKERQCSRQIQFTNG